MAYFKFADQIMHGDTIDVYNHGNMESDFTYVDDIINGISALIHHPPAETGGELHRIVNIGRSNPVNLLTFIELLEKYLGKEAKEELTPYPAR